MDHWLIPTSLRMLEDMVIVLGPIFIGLLLFVWQKRRQQKQLILSVIRYGLWRGSGERIEG